MLKVKRFIGSRLKALRTQAGLSTRDLGMKIKRGHSTISKIEDGTVETPSAKTIGRLCRAFNVTPDFFYN